MITGVARRSGFALPTILIASVVMMIVLLSSVIATAGVRNAIMVQQYERMAQLAGEAGAAYAQSCVQYAQAAGIPASSLWDNTKPLKPNTDCSGNELVACPTVAASVRCAVAIDGNARSSFSIEAPTLDADGNVQSIPMNGYVDILRTSNNAVWRTYRQPQVQPLVVPDLCGGAATNALGWTYALALNNPKYFTSAAQTISSDSDTRSYPGPRYYRKDFTITDAGSYTVQFADDDQGLLYIDGQLILSVLHPNAGSANVSLTAGCHTIYIRSINTGLMLNPEKIQMSLSKTGSNIPIVKTDTTWRASHGVLKHFSQTGYYQAANAWNPVKDMGDVNTSMNNTWNTVSGVPARGISTVHSVDGSGYHPSNSYTYLRDSRDIVVTSPTDVFVTYTCDDRCGIYMDGQKIAQYSEYPAIGTVTVTLTEGSHRFGISLGNVGGPSSAALAVKRISDGAALTYTDLGWRAAYFWETTDNASLYYSYDNDYTPNPNPAQITAPSVAEANYAPDYSNFTLNGNATYNSSTGVLTLGTGFVWSPLLLVNKATEVWFGGDFYTNIASAQVDLAPKGGWHLVVYYFGADGTTPVYNTWGYQNNGCAQPLNLGVWTSNDQRCRFAAGPNVVYVRYYLYSSAYGYASSDLATKNAIMTLH